MGIIIHLRFGFLNTSRFLFLSTSKYYQNKLHQSACMQSASLKVMQVSYDTNMNVKSIDCAYKCADEMANHDKLKELNFLEATYKANKKEKKRNWKL